jgi:hypothetical protein
VPQSRLPFFFLEIIIISMAYTLLAHKLQLPAALQLPPWTCHRAALSAILKIVPDGFTSR